MEKSYFITEHTENEKNPWYDTERTVILEEIHYLLSLLILLIQHHHFDLDPVEAWGVKKIAWPNDFGAGGSKGHYKVLLLQSPTRKRAQKLGKQQIQLELTEYNQVQLKM